MASPEMGADSAEPDPDDSFWWVAEYLVSMPLDRVSEEMLARFFGPNLVIERFPVVVRTRIYLRMLKNWLANETPANAAASSKNRAESARIPLTWLAMLEVIARDPVNDSGFAYGKNSRQNLAPSDALVSSLERAGEGEPDQYAQTLATVSSYVVAVEDSLGPCRLQQLERAPATGARGDRAGRGKAVAALEVLQPSAEGHEYETVRRHLRESKEILHKIDDPLMDTLNKAKTAHRMSEPSGSGADPIEDPHPSTPPRFIQKQDEGTMQRWGSSPGESSGFAVASHGGAIADPLGVHPPSRRRSDAYDREVGPTGRRKKMKWTAQEIDRLTELVSKYGAGKWKKMLIEGGEVFSHRTEVDLKDKWRNMLVQLKKESMHRAEDG